MNRVSTRALLAVALAAFACAAHSQSFRAYLSSAGNDANPCSVTQPCRLLPAALAAVTSSGEIWMLDSANYNSGTVTVSKNVSIRAIPGQVGSIVAVGGNPAMVVSPGVSVSLKNLSFTYNAISPGGTLISMTTGTVDVEDSTLSADMNQYAIYSVGAGRLTVLGSTFRGPGSGLYAQDGMTVEVANSRFIGAANCTYAQAFTAGTTTTLSVRDSVFTGCQTGVAVLGIAANAIGKGNVVRSTFLDGAFGVIAQGNGAGTSAIVTISGNDASGNSTVGFGQYFTGGVLESLGNNTARNNAANTVGTITPASPI